MTKLSYYDLDDIINYAIDFDIKNSDISENDIVELLIDYISSRLNVDNSKAEKIYGFAYTMRRDIGMESICWCVERLIDLIKDVQ